MAARAGRIEGLSRSAGPAGVGIDLSAAVEAALPGFIPPMLATLADRPFDDPDWLFEVKWDGYRIEAVAGDGQVGLFTRTGHDAGSYFPDLLGPPDWIAAREAIVDGEIVALDPDGLPSFELLQARLGGRPRGGPAPPDRSAGRASLVYQVFDLLHLDGRSLLRVRLEDRKRLLRSVLRERPDIRYAGHVEADGVAFYRAVVERGLEGVVAKRRASPYLPGRRSPDWLKLKARPEQEFVVGGYLPGEGRHASLGSLLLGVYENGVLRYAGRVGSGIDERTRRALRGRLDALARPLAPFDPLPPLGADLHRAHWVEPALVVRVRFANWTRDGIVRQASLEGVDPEGDPATVIRERPTEAPSPRRPRTGPPSRPSAPADASGLGVLSGTVSAAELAALDRLGREGTWRVRGRELRLTNLDKVLFPPRPESGEPPLTKRDLVRYFAVIAPVMLPHLEGRPLNLHRFPGGAAGAGFWQRNVPTSAPAWLHRWREPGQGAREANVHLVADELAALVWLANQAAFEIHAWTTRRSDLEHPTHALVDIDPGARTTWQECLVIARLFRTALGHLGLASYPKLTGRRGIHIWIPIVPRYSFADTATWVERLSRAVGSTVPDLVSWEWPVAEREGRARLDYTQNAPGRTLVAPYAVRPAAGAPVSAPISWDELDDPSIRPGSWTIRSIVPRVAERGDLFAGALGGYQELPPL